MAFLDWQPTVPDYSKGLESASDAVSYIGSLRRQRERDKQTAAYENAQIAQMRDRMALDTQAQNEAELRRKREEQGALIEKMPELMRTDPALAMAYAKAHGLSLEKEPGAAQAMPMPGGPTSSGEAAAGLKNLYGPISRSEFGGAMKTGAEAGAAQAPAKDDVLAGLSDKFEGLTGGLVRGGENYLAARGVGAEGMPPQAPPPSPPPLTPPAQQPVQSGLGALPSAVKAPADRYRLTGEGGLSVLFDPEGAKQKEIGERRARADEWLNSGDLDLQEPASAAAAKIAHSYMLNGATVGQADQLHAQMMMAINAERARKEEREAARAEQEKLLQMKGAQAGELAKVRAGLKPKGAGGGGLKERTAERQELSVFDREFADWKKTVDWKAVEPMNRQLKAAAANIVSSRPEDIVKNRDAQLQMARFFRGSVTEGEMHMVWENIGGKFGPNAWERFKQKATTGQLTPLEIANIQESIKTAQDEYKKLLADKYNAARKTFGGRSHAGLGDIVNDRIQGAFLDVGIDVPPIYDTSGMASPMLGSRKGAKGVTAAPSPRENLSNQVDKWMSEIPQR